MQQKSTESRRSFGKFSLSCKSFEKLVYNKEDN